MKIECVKERLEYGVLKAEKITGKNLPLAILSSVVLEAKQNTLTLRSTNLDMGLELTIPAKVIETGTVAIPGGVLSRFLGTLGDFTSTIEIEVVGTQLHIAGKNSSTLIKTQAADEFPIIPKLTKEQASTFTIRADKFVEALRSVFYAAAPSDIKPEIGSVALTIDQKYVVAVATDSFRLAEKKVELRERGGSPDAPLLIPQKNTAEIIRIFESSNEDLDVIFNKNQLVLSTPELYFTTRLVDGVFPDYREIIPKKYTTETVVLKHDLAQALKMSSVFSDKFNQVNVRVIPSEKLFEISSRSEQTGETVLKVDAATTGEAIDLNFNGRYLLEALPFIPGDSVSLEFTGKDRPVVVTSASNKSFLYLVMPLNK